MTTIAKNALPVPRLKTLPRPAKRLAAGLGEGVGEACPDEGRGVSLAVGMPLGEAETVGEGRGVPTAGEGVAETAPAETEILAEAEAEIIF